MTIDARCTVCKCRKICKYKNDLITFVQNVRESLPSIDSKIISIELMIHCDAYEYDNTLPANGNEDEKTS